jgi:hypothetical protein
MADDRDTAPGATTTHTSPEPSRRPERLAKPTAKVREVLVSLGERRGPARNTASTTARGNGGTTLGGTTLGGRTSVAQKLLAMVENSRQDMTKLKDVLMLQTRAIDKLYRRMDKVKLELVTVKIELAITREEVAVVKR